MGTERGWAIGNNYEMAMEMPEAGGIARADVDVASMTIHSRLDLSIWWAEGRYSLDTVTVDGIVAEKQPHGTRIPA